MPNQDLHETVNGTRKQKGSSIKERVVQRFVKPKPYVVIQEPVSGASMTSIQYVKGEPVFLGGNIGVLSADFITWHTDGMDMMIISKTLNPSEMMQIAEDIDIVVPK
jgi:hypothetical protein